MAGRSDCRQFVTEQATTLSDTLQPYGSTVARDWAVSAWRRLFGPKSAVGTSAQYQVARTATHAVIIDTQTGHGRHFSRVSQWMRVLGNPSSASLSRNRCNRDSRAGMDVFASIFGNESRQLA
jgi:hypothetical protein